MTPGTPATPRFSYKSDRLKPLRAFCQTVRLGSVSRAAEALFVSQPAVSQQLQALERELGVVLFERSGRRLVPSREGQLLYEMAQPLVESLDGLEAGFRDKVRGLDAGELTVAANASTILYLLPKIVEAFRQRHPEVRLTLQDAISADGTALLRSDAADLVVGSMLDVPGDLSYAPVYDFEQVLITPLGHPLAGMPSPTLDDLSPWPLILPPKRQITWRLVDLVFQRHRVPYTVALEVGGWEVIKQYVAMDMGISIVTALCLNDSDRERLAIRPMAGYFPSRSYGVTVRRGKALSPQARAFIELIRPDLFAPRQYDDTGPSER
ncbi:LysR family transcriptional regulator [Stenotrophomonas mori]|uniref:LysR family transcriptional regulator n=1 Tax=Stenotrophomonas mori TaxID=2871096 RepID=A0ABT0SGT9_9GAMM|nr:LysR family transcriptional regulator [Stenotrophomonas mori]MCL7714541.1 LysR family transcriptional regulator [Stenotrophomonas mori]